MILKSLNGLGQVVTATFVHESAKVLDLVFQPTGVFSDDGRLFPEGAAPTLENSSSPKSASSTMDLGVTTAHSFWSVTRNDYIPAGELQLFEQVVTIDGQIWRLTSITPRAGPETVYNFEVAREHVYYVGSDGLLVHNLYVYAVLHKTKGIAYVGIGTGSRKISAMARVAKKLGYADSAALKAAGYSVKFTSGAGKSPRGVVGFLSPLDYTKLVSAKDRSGCPFLSVNSKYFLRPANCIIDSRKPVELKAKDIREERKVSARDPREISAKVCRIP